MCLNPLSTNPREWSNTLEHFVGYCRRIVRVCLTILRGWHEKNKIYFILYESYSSIAKFLMSSLVYQHVSQFVQYVNVFLFALIIFRVV